MKIDTLLKLMTQKDASDLYLKPHRPAFLKINGQITNVDDKLVSEEDMKSFLKDLFPLELLDRFYQEKEIDIGCSLKEVGRFRINGFFQQTQPALAIRFIKSQIPSFKQLNLPVNVLENLSLENRGLILVTGRAGSGKSTTIASMIDYINDGHIKHIVTIEDPIEFIFEEKKSIINQREIEFDTKSFPVALRHLTRQAPDVIFIGEIRDLESLSCALMAAETGHLVISTLHTVDAVQTVERIINFFPTHLHEETRLRLSLILKGVISLRLLKCKDNQGRIPACEVMLLTPTVKKLISEGKIGDIYFAIQDGELFGMQTFNQSLLKLYKSGLVSLEEAMDNSDSKDELDLAIKEIYSGRDTHRINEPEI
jgi:pilus retraction protein PilT